MKFLIILLINLVVVYSEMTFPPARTNFSKPPITHYHIESRIIGGQKVSLGQIPWQVILSRKPNKGFFCGGSIISSEWVLTAAHCTEGRKSITLSFGSVNLKDPAPIVMISEIFVQHPQYNRKTLANDISLIMLPVSLKFSNIIQSINLVSRSQASDSFLGKNALITGFGYTNDEILDYSNDLLYALVEIIDNQICADIYGPGTMLPTEICARGIFGSIQNICNGDSGGALVSIDNNGKAIQIGINSYAAEFKCTEFYPSGYTRIGSYLDFISGITGIPF